MTPRPRRAARRPRPRGAGASSGDTGVTDRLGRLRDALAPRAPGDGLVAAAPALAVRTVFARFWPYARPYARWFALTFLFILLAPVIDAALVWVFKLVVDDVLVPRDFGPFWWIALLYVG